MALGLECVHNLDVMARISSKLMRRGRDGFAAMHESGIGRLCCKTLLSISARNIDSRSGANTQQRFKRTGAPILLFQISISQSLLGDFCNTIGQIRTSADVFDTTASPSRPDIPDSPSDVAEGPTGDICGSL